MVVQYFPFGSDQDPAFANHINSIVDAVNTAGPSTGGASGEGSIAESQDAATGRVTVDGVLTRYLYRYIHYRITSDAEGTTLINNLGTFSGSQIYVGVNNNSDAAVPGTTFQYAPFAWGNGFSLSYRTAGFGSIVFSTRAVAEPSEVAIAGGTGTIDTTDVTAAGEQGPVGPGGLSVAVTSNIGTAFRNSAGSPSTATATLNDGGTIPDDNAHSMYDYRWEHEGQTICVMNDRTVISDPSGNPLTSSDGMTCTTGIVADSTVSTALGGNLRSIILGPEDVNMAASLDCIISNIPD